MGKHQLMAIGVFIVLILIFSLIGYSFYSTYENGERALKRYMDAKQDATEYCLTLEGCQKYSCLATISITYQEGSYYLLEEQNCLIKNKGEKNG